MTTITNTNTNIDIANIKLSKKFKEANIRFQAAWTQWPDDAQSWAIYLNELIDILHYEHHDIQISLIERIAGISTDKAKIEVAQTIRDLETGELFKSGKSYQLDTHLIKSVMAE